MFRHVCAMRRLLTRTALPRSGVGRVVITIFAFGFRLVAAGRFGTDHVGSVLAEVV